MGRVVEILVIRFGVVSDVIQLESSSSFTLGEGTDVDLVVDGGAFPDPARHPLVLVDTAGRAELCLCSGMTGVVGTGCEGEAPAPIEVPAGAVIRLSLDAVGCAQVTLAGLELRVRGVEGETLARSRRPLDLPFLTTLVTTGVIAAAYAAVLALSPQDARPLADDAEPAYARYLERAPRARLAEPKAQAPELELEPEPTSREQPRRRQTHDFSMRRRGDARAKGSGRGQGGSGMGRSPSAHDGRLLGRNFDPELAVRNAGILGLLAQEGGHVLEGHPCGGCVPVNDYDRDVWGDLTGEEVGEAYGVGGLGLVGTGRGGGGEGGLIGLGTTDLIGLDEWQPKRETGDPFCCGVTNSGFAKSVSRTRRPVARVRVAQATISGTIERELVRRISKAHVAELRRCYASSLARHPGLEGELVISYVIDPAGRVSRSVSEASMTAAPELDRCFARAVEGWRFPGPNPAGLTIVSQTFRLSLG